MESEREPNASIATKAPPSQHSLRGTGRFNLTLGAITTAVGLGAALSQAIAGSIVHHAGFRAGFLFLASMALAAFAILYLFMPETRNLRLEDA
jgi:MFS family permease